MDAAQRYRPQKNHEQAPSQTLIARLIRLDGVRRPASLFPSVFSDRPDASSAIADSPPESPVAQFCRRLKRDERWPANDDRFVPFRQRGPTDQIGSEHVGVDHDRTRLPFELPFVNWALMFALACTQEKSSDVVTMWRVSLCISLNASRPRLSPEKCWCPGRSSISSSGQIFIS
jgi:hypothetical protein